MKAFIIIIVLLLPTIGFAQKDTSYTLSKMKFNLLYVDMSEKDTVKISGLQTLTIHGDSIVTESSAFDIDNLEGISFRVGNYGFWRGAKHGAIAGSIVGLFAIYAYGNRIDWGHEGGSIILLPILLSGSAILGAITGGIISMSNGRYLDYKLSGTPDYKRAELKRLMEKWGKR